MLPIHLFDMLEKKLKVFYVKNYILVANNSKTESVVGNIEQNTS